MSGKGDMETSIKRTFNECMKDSEDNMNDREDRYVRSVELVKHRNRAKLCSLLQQGSLAVMAPLIEIMTSSSARMSVRWFSLSSNSKPFEACRAACVRN